MDSNETLFLVKNRLVERSRPNTYELLQLQKGTLQCFIPTKTNLTHCHQKF